MEIQVSAMRRTSSGTGVRTFTFSMEPLVFRQVGAAGIDGTEESAIMKYTHEYIFRIGRRMCGGFVPIGTRHTAKYIN